MLLSLFRPLIERVKAMLALCATQELQAEALLRQAERKAELLRKAKEYQDQGLSTVADLLRSQAELLDSPQPLAGVLSSVELLAASTESPPSLPTPNPPAQTGGTGRKAR